MVGELVSHLEDVVAVVEADAHDLVGARHQRSEVEPVEGVARPVTGRRPLAPPVAPEHVADIGRVEFDHAAGVHPGVDPDGSSRSVRSDRCQSHVSTVDRRRLRSGPMTDLGSYLELPGDTGFGLDNLPYGIGSVRGPDGSRTVFVAVGDDALDLAAAQRAGVFDAIDGLAGDEFVQPTLNRFMATGHRTWTPSTSGSATS